MVDDQCLKCGKWFKPNELCQECDEDRKSRDAVYDAAMKFKKLKQDPDALHADVEWAEYALIEACSEAEEVERG